MAVGATSTRVRKGGVCAGGGPSCNAARRRGQVATHLPGKVTSTCRATVDQREAGQAAPARGKGTGC